MNRRNLLKGSVLAATAFAIRPICSLAATVENAASRLTTLERKHGGRLGVAVLDTGSGHRISHRGGERFLICSTFKLLLVAAVLERVDLGVERMDRRIAFNKGAILDWAPVTGINVGPPGMSVQELCEAAILVSDNTAANLLLKTMGGPAGLTTYARGLGDNMTRLDHLEPLSP
ncbi:MAG: serine hydrolase [Salinisphaera sp.]|jgi:beta-lactamase class A|nr:serine hydrolase [Salinisphaera sp.]